MKVKVYNSLIKQIVRTSGVQRSHSLNAPVSLIILWRMNSLRQLIARSAVRNVGTPPESRVCPSLLYTASAPETTLTDTTAGFL